MRWLVVAVLVLFASACGSDDSDAPAVPPTVTAATVSAAPSGGVDADARAACSQIEQARILHEVGKSETPAPGYGASTSEMRASAAELKALDLALKSSSPELQAIGGEANASALRSWCQGHHL